MESESVCGCVCVCPKTSPALPGEGRRRRWGARDWRGVEGRWIGSGLEGRRGPGMEGRGGGEEGNQHVPGPPLPLTCQALHQ